MSSSRALRVVAALLAAVGLLARPAQAVVVCPMETPMVTESAVVDEHAHHDGHSASTAAATAEATSPTDELPSEAPDHEVCPDLAHCAVASPASVHELSVAGARVHAERARAAQDRPTSAVASLEPPPPKRS